MRRPLPLVVLAALAVSAAARHADARPTKVALTEIDGDTTGIWMAMEDALDDKNLQVVPTRHVTHVIEQLGLDVDLANGDIERLAAELAVDAIVQGVFEPRTRKVRFTIFAKGRRGKPFSIAANKAGTEQFRKQVHTTMLAKLAAAMAARPVAADRDDMAGDDARSPKARKAGKQTPPKDDDETAAEASDSGKKARKTQKTKDADSSIELAGDDDGPANARKARKTKVAEAVAEPRDGGKQAKKGTRAPKAKDARAARADDDDVVEVVDDDDSPQQPASTRPPKDTETAAKETKETQEAKAPQETQEAKAPQETQEAKAPQETKAQTADDAQATPDEPSAPAAAPRAAAKQVAERKTERETEREDGRDTEAPPAARARFEPSQPAVHSANRAGVRLDLGSSLSARDLRFQTTGLATPPRAYKNLPVPGGRVEGALYPFALGNPDSWLAGLGVAGDFDQTIALTLRASAEMTVPLKITERHYSYGLRYRLAFGHRPTSPTLTFGGGYGRRTFMVNRTGLMTPASLDLPDVDYKLFDPGLALRLPLGGRVALTLEGRALLVTAAGPIQRADQYGRATIPGGTAAAGLEIIVSSHVALRLAAEATQFDYKFLGTGTLATGRDGDSTTLDVRRATDRYLGGAGTLAVFY